MVKSKKWLLERKTYLGGSDIAAICGLSDFSTALEIYFDKTSPDISEKEMTEEMRWGVYLESVIAKVYAKKTNNKVSVEKKLLRHPKYSFLAANIDRWVNDKQWVLECKTTGHFMASKWGEENTDDIPNQYICQIAMYAAICDVPRVDLAVLIGGQKFKIFTYNRNKPFEEKLIKIACNFWNENILKKVPPSVIPSDNISALFPKSNGLKIHAEEHIFEKIDNLKVLKYQEKNLAKEIEAIIFEIKSYMKDYEILVDSYGNCLATWKNTNSRATIDLKKLEEEHHDLFIQYMKEPKTTRTFLIKQ